MNKREPKQTDQNEANKAYQILKECMITHTEVESTIWAAVVWSCLVTGYVDCDVSYDEFAEELDRVKVHYKNWFDK